MSEGFKSKASFCKELDGNMMTDIKSSLVLWQAHFNATFNGDDTNNSANEMIRHSRRNTLDNTTPVVLGARQSCFYQQLRILA